MSYKNNYKKPVKASIPTPASATQDTCEQTEEAILAHYREVLTLPLLVSNRKGCYATIINSTINGQPLEQVVGTDNAKFMTETVLNKISASFSAIEIK